MSITIKFDNYNGGLEEGVRVYRDVAPIADGALPAPIASLPPSSNTFVDETAVRGTKYYYRFGVFQGVDELISPNKAVLVVAPNDTGPGPKTIVHGDWDLGYFGYCPSSDFTAYGGLATLLGITTSGTVQTDYGWLKVAYKGKVLFISRGAAIKPISFVALYQAGVVYGTNDNGPAVPTGATATNQYKPQTIAGYTFIPRLLKGAPDNSAVPALKAAANAVQTDPHEFEDIMAMFASTGRSTSDTTFGRFGRIDHLQLPNNTVQSHTEHVQQQASWPVATAVCRSQRLNDNFDVRIPTVFKPDAGVGSGSYANGGGTYSIQVCWRSVMELVI